AQRSRAKIPPAAPREGVIALESAILLTLLKRPHRRSPDPAIPIQILRHRILALGPLDALRPDRAIRPGVHFLDRAQHAALHVLDADAPTFLPVPLVAHLRGHFVFL